MNRKFIVALPALLVSICIIMQFGACGKKTVPYDENLLANHSFETVKDNLPAGWHLEPFHGIEGSKTVEYGVSEEEAFGGEKSFFFRGSDDTQRWFALSQEIEIPPGVKQVRLQGALKLKDVARRSGQYTHCNFIVTFYDRDHERFQELRYADKRTRVQEGTTEWISEDHTFRVPHNTGYIAVGCLLGMTGTVWFDEISLSIPKPADWLTQSTNNFDFYWLPGHEFPDGAIENQQKLFDHYVKQLDATDDIRISYYLYPDSATIRRMLSLKGVIYISWDDREIHTINPNNDHEIIHFITDQYGAAPKAIAEGCVTYLHGEWNGKPVHLLARELLLKNQLPLLNELLNYGDLVQLDIDKSMPAAASFFGYLYESRGPEKILKLFREASGVNSYPTFAVAFEKVYNTPLNEVEKRWRGALFGAKIETKEDGQPQP